MANRYWVGGSGNADSTTNWSTSTGGPSGASVPTSSDAVFIDSNSGFNSGGYIQGLVTYTIDCSSFTMSQLGTVTFASDPSSGNAFVVTIYGSAIFLNIDPFSPPLAAFQGAGASTVLMQGSALYDMRILLSSPTDSVTLLDNITAVGDLIMTGGIFDCNGHSVTIVTDFSGQASIDLRYATVNGTIYFRTGTIKAKSFQLRSAGAGGVISVNCGTSTLTTQGVTQFFLTGTYYNIVCNATSNFTTDSSPVTVSTLTLARGFTYRFVGGQTWNLVNQVIQTGSGTTTIVRLSGAGNYIWSSATTITLSNLNITNGTASGSGEPFYASGTSVVDVTCVNWIHGSPPSPVSGGWEFVGSSPKKTTYTQPFQDFVRVIPRAIVGLVPEVSLHHYKPPYSPPSQDVLPNRLRGLSGFEASVPPAYRASWRQATNLNVLPTVLQGFEGFEASPALQYKISGLRALNLDVLPNLLHGLLGFEASIPPAYRASWHQTANVDVLPTVLQGFAGFETSQASPYRIPGLVALNLDVLPALLQGFAGFEASQASPYRIPGLTALNLDVLPALLQGFAGFEVSQASPYQIPSRASLNLDVLAKLVTFIGGFETNQLAMYRRFKIDSSFLEVFPSTTTRLFSFEASSSPPSQYKIRPLQALTLDVLPNVPTQVIYPYTPDLSEPVSRYPHPLWTPSDDYWPGLIVPPTPPSRLGVGGGEYVCETEEDINRRECLEKTIQAIDGELAELERKDRAPSDLKIIEPDVMPPDWQAGDDEYSQDERGYWYDPRDPNTYGRPVRPRSKAGKRSGEPFPGRHVHYNFASDMDFGVRRRIIGILDRAEHRGAQIFGSDAFVTQLEGNIQGHLIVPGTNAWVVQLGPEERLAVAREAVAEGFRLVSFDDTSLSFIHRPTYPWKTLFLGATLGAGLMGAGVGVGYLAWGRDLKRLQASENSSPKPKSRKKK